MTEENLDVQESENTEGAENTETTQEVDEQKDYKQMFEDQRIRAEKAEKALKAKAESTETEVKEETPKSLDLSSEDILALTDVKDKEQRQFLIQKSKEMGKSISELQDDKYIVAALNLMAEEKATAEATSTGKGNRGTKSQTPEAIIEAVNSGKLDDPVKHAEAEMALRIKRAKEERERLGR